MALHDYKEVSRASIFANGGDAHIEVGETWLIVLPHTDRRVSSVHIVQLTRTTVVFKDDSGLSNTIVRYATDEVRFLERIPADALA